ncbi:septal ring lytic transglycosylase RlpA family protein [Hydrogenophaga defluvii]|uniref:Endolytic peptidoglycan transglycosylase RlpA n=1 Tax=Hydrogenophaga defluvii TaxID=249410 RepID=A0ABW2SEI5_9BURK
MADAEPATIWQDPIDRRVGVPAAIPLVLEQGQASWYANRFHGRLTASGERYDKNALTAAHPTLPFGTEVLVRSLRTGREVLVRIVDRGPHLKSRIIDLSHAAAEALGIRQQGVSEVQLIQP